MILPSNLFGGYIGHQTSYLKTVMGRYLNYRLIIEFKLALRSNFRRFPNSKNVA